MPKKESGMPNVGEETLESKVAKPSASPTNSKDQLLNVKKYASVLNETVSQLDDLQGEEFDSIVELEARRDVIDKDIEMAQQALDRQAKKCAELLLAEWPADDAVEQTLAESRRINSDLVRIDERLKQLNRVPANKEHPGFNTLKGLAIELENKKQILSDWEERHIVTAPKAKELEKLLAESQEMGAIRRTFSGINGKIAELKNSSIDGPIKDSEREVDMIAQLKKGVKELTSKLEAMKDEASQLEIQKIELKENLEIIGKPLVDIRKRSGELLSIIRNERNTGADLQYNKMLLAKYLEK